MPDKNKMCPLIKNQYNSASISSKAQRNKTLKTNRCHIFLSFLFCLLSFFGFYLTCLHSLTGLPFLKLGVGGICMVICNAANSFSGQKSTLKSFHVIIGLESESQSSLVREEILYARSTHANAPHPQNMYVEICPV